MLTSSKAETLLDHAFEAGDRLQAFHTKAPALTPRAVDTLLRLGRFDEAVLLWADCVEIQHFPPAITGARGVEACRRAGLPHVSTWHANAAGIAEDGTNSHLWAPSQGLQSSQGRGQPPQTLGLESIPQCLREVDLLRIRSGLCARLAMFTVSSCRLLSRMVLERLTREKYGFFPGCGSKAGGSGETPRCCPWPAGNSQGATLRQERAASFGTGLGQWKPSSSPSTPLALHAVAPVPPSAPLVAPHVVVNARVGAPSAGFEQSARHIDRKWLGAAALATSSFSERPEAASTPQALCKQRVRPKAGAMEVDPRPSPELGTELADLFAEAN